MRKQQVELGERSYNIYIEKGLIASVAKQVRQAFNPTSVCIVTDSNLSSLYLPQLLQDFEAARISVCSFVIPAGEGSKNLASLEALCTYLMQRQFDRHSMLVALGGGVVGDLTGFAASVYKRGIPFVQIATSVVAQTDSSVGGKTGIDFGGAKNMLGTFHQPSAVYIDPNVLRTLPKRFLCDGLGEVVKYAVLAGGELYNRVMTLSSPEDFLNDDGYILEACVAYKRHLVECDEHDRGPRFLLNLGHTLGHAIESYYGYGRYTHGEAVSIGIAEMLSYAACYYGLETSVQKDVCQLLERLELPIRIAGDRQAIFKQVLQDKKCQGDQIRIALPYAPGDVRVTPISITLFLEQILSMQN